MTLSPDRIAALAEELLKTRDAGRQVPPISEREPGFDRADALAIADRVRRLRLASGERLAGRKIGFTNRTLWDRYGVDGPIWGDVYASTLHRLGAMPVEVRVPPLPEPRIEPEIVFGLAKAPRPGMDPQALAGCIAWVAHGFEIVTSIFPGWQFTAADTLAGFGLHGVLIMGAPQPLSVLGEDPVAALSGLELTLEGGEVRAEGRGADVLDGPVQALGHLVEALAQAPGANPLAPGEVVTTGTLTDAMPLTRGERWRTELRGAALPGLDVTFR
jgi:2-oxo-3-hexenedioate decarboxylase